MLWTMTKAPSKAKVPTDDAKARGEGSAYEGQVRPRTKESRSRSRSTSPEDPTKHTKHTEELSSKRPDARAVQLYKLRPPPGATAVLAVGEDDAVVPRWMVEGCGRQRRRVL
jgi:hypothetical protein